MAFSAANNNWAIGGVDAATMGRLVPFSNETVQAVAMAIGWKPGRDMQRRAAPSLWTVLGETWQQMAVELAAMMEVAVPAARARPGKAQGALRATSSAEG
eukprot:3938129-Rhodomonas_salina.1